jgi:hypothetical protein
MNESILKLSIISSYFEFEEEAYSLKSWLQALES